MATRLQSVVTIMALPLTAIFALETMNRMPQQVTPSVPLLDSLEIAAMESGAAFTREDGKTAYIIAIPAQIIGTPRDLFCTLVTEKRGEIAPNSQARCDYQAAYRPL